MSFDVSEQLSKTTDCQEINMQICKIITLKKQDFFARRAIEIKSLDYKRYFCVKKLICMYQSYYI